MKIALSMRITLAEDYDEPRDCIAHDWIHRIESWGWTPLLIPNVLKSVASYLEILNPDILVVTGGDNIGHSRLRDCTENAALDYAEENRLPTLGVCRGLQIISNRYGGNLHGIEGHVRCFHSVTFSPDWEPIYGKTATVNSYHTQAIRAENLGDTLTPIATDSRGNVEAACSNNLPLVAVMWHPERDVCNDADRTMIKRLATEGMFWT